MTQFNIVTIFFQMRKYESHCQTLDYEICTNMTASCRVKIFQKEHPCFYTFVHLQNIQVVISQMGFEKNNHLKHK